METLVELTNEDKTLASLIKAVRNNDFEAFRKTGKGLSQYYYMAQVTEEGVLLIDNRIAVPESLRNAVLNWLHRGHPGQQKMIDAASYIWWPKMNRKIVEKAEKCADCIAIGKNIKSVKPHANWDEIPDPTSPNEEIQMDFAGPYCISKNRNTYILVTVDKFSKFPSAMITSSTSSTKVIKFPKTYIALHGVPKIL